jgi:hypothetical protein
MLPLYRRRLPSASWIECPEPGDRHAGFLVEPMRCWALVYDRTMQADHCAEPPNWTGRWFSPAGDRWWRVWPCPGHTDGLTGLWEFGRRRHR